MSLRTAALLMAAAAAATPDAGYFRYERAIGNVPQSGQTCVAIDGGVFAHASPALADLRLYRDGAEMPYAIHRAAAIEGGERSIAPVNLGKRGGQTVFDAAMPEGSYSDVELAVGAKDFIATVTVTGSQAETGGVETKVGSYTIFDLSKQRLGRSTMLHLPDSDFRYLHFGIAGPILPESVTGLSVGRLPAGQPKYVTVAESANETQKGRTSMFEFDVPARVPVDRIVFEPASEPKNFSRDVTVTVLPVASQPVVEGNEPREFVAASGNVLRVNSVQDGKKIEEERLEIDGPGSEYGTAGKWRVAIQNGDDRPLEIKRVRLEMVERSLCFDAAAGGSYTLFYGDAALGSPQYDYARLFTVQADAARATVGPEQLNAAFHSRPDQRPFSERYPWLLWIALVAVVGLLGAITLRSAKRGEQTQ